MRGKRLFTWVICVIGLGGLGVIGTGDAGETVLDTGKIKIICGREGGGFLDEVFLDRNGDGVYAGNERIVLRPPDQAGLYVAYRVPAPDKPFGRTVAGQVRVKTARVEGEAVAISGELLFGALGRTPFEVKVHAKKGTAVVRVAFRFAPLKAAPTVALQEASLRVFGAFDRRQPKGRMRYSSAGAFRVTPRPKSSWQPLMWQLGGHLVESPWYWREWVAWSESCGPVTTREGHTPPRELSYLMHDNTHGIQALIKEPAVAAPVELGSSGLPTFLALYAWTPRVRPLRLTGPLPERFFLRGAALHFFATDLEKLARSGTYWKKRGEIVKASLAELRKDLPAAESNLYDRRIPAPLRESRLKDLAGANRDGWAANVASVSWKETPEARLEGADHGKGWVKLLLDAPLKEDTKSVPVQGGVPFPRGALASVENVRLVTETGVEVSCQVERLARWPDGSVKWALVTALVDVKGGARAVFKLEYGPGVRRQAAAAGKLELQQTPEGVTVNTGALKFTIKNSSGGFFDEVWRDLDGDGRFEESERLVSSDPKARGNRMDLIAVERPGEVPPFAFAADGAKVEPSRAVVESIEVERRGPLSLNLVVRGRYRYATLGRGRGKNYKNEGCEFWVRYTAYAGQPYVEVKHSYVFEGNPDREMIHDLGLSLKPVLGAKRIFTVGGDGKARAVPLEAEGSAAGIYQDNPHAFELWKAGKGGESVRAMGHVAEGWADLSDGRRGVTFGLRAMQKTYAKELSVEGGRLFASLWPRRARYLDTRRYSRQYGDGESTSFGQGVAEGVAHTQDLFFFFHAGDAKAGQAALRARALLRPAYFKADPRWYASTNAAGLFAPRDPKRHAQWETMLTDGLDYFLYHQKLWAWYGHYDYGDFQQRPNGRGGWQKLAGRWGWVNNEALVDLWIYEQFMRTGRRAYLDAALALTRHVLDVDLINSHNYKGNTHVKMHGHRHNVNHWGDGYVGIRVAAPHGFRLGYYLTGDLRFLDQLRMIMKAHWNSVHKYDKQHATGLGALTFFWEATGEAKYKKALDAYLDYQVAHAKKFGHIHNGVWKFGRDQGKPLGEKPLSGAPTIFFFQNFGSAYSLMELADLTGRRDVADALVQFARRTIKERGRLWSAAYCHYRLMAFAYRHSGDKAFLNYALANAKRLRFGSRRETWAVASPMNSFDNKLSMLAWTGQGLPYLMKAIELRKDDPVVSFTAPKLLKIPHGKTRATASVDGTPSKAKSGTVVKYEWRLGGKMLSRKAKDRLPLGPGVHYLTLWATDDQGRRGMAQRRVTVWEPGTLAQICFSGDPDGFQRCKAFNEADGFGFLPGTRIRRTSEPRRYGGKGCKEVYITGTVQVKTGPGTFIVEMGGKDFWTVTMGRVAIQGKELALKIKKASSKKIEWGYRGEVTVGAEGLLKMDFLRGKKGEPVVLAYIIVRKK